MMKFSLTPFFTFCIVGSSCFFMACSTTTVPTDFNGKWLLDKKEKSVDIEGQSCNQEVGEGYDCRQKRDEIMKRSREDNMNHFYEEQYVNEK